ncbi:piggyBac transposable element-derived protein 4-like [Liolophura sinensis]|uniref:piggyBac transposable element-derived protein 4-like n=1 Tax=Liolophura sinensis TaxID=3198878 RepID=UPI00315985DC
MADADPSRRRAGVFEVFSWVTGEGESDSDSDFDMPNDGSDSEFDVIDNLSSDSEGNGRISDAVREDGDGHVLVRSGDCEAQNNITTSDNPWIIVQEPENEDHLDIHVPDFSVRHPGPRNAPARNSDPIEYFSLYFDEDMFVHLVRETNAYACNFLNEPSTVHWIDTRQASRFKKWPENGIGVVEMKKFLGLCINMGLIRTAGKELNVVYDDGQAHGVVMRLMEVCNLLNKGYHLFTDNFYTKPKLAEALFEQKTLLTGTVRVNSKGLSKDVANARLQPGETLYARKDNILTVTFREKKARGNQNVEKEVRGKVKQKPAMVFHYNVHIGGVDLSDKKICHIAAERPTHRYWVKIFRNLLDIAILNSYEVYKLNTDREKMLDKHGFVVAIVESLCGSLEKQPPATPPAPEHHLKLLDGRKERDCVVCSDRYSDGVRKRSRHWCPGCNVGCHANCEPNLEHYPRPARVGRKRRVAPGVLDEREM